MKTFSTDNSILKIGEVSIYTGNSLPSSGVGKKGDVFIRTDEPLIYSKVSNSDWDTINSTLDNIGIKILGIKNDISELPPIANPADAYVIIDNLFVWNAFQWIDIGSIRGIIGFTGSQGITGFDGSKGDIGFTGSQGDIGFTGSQGITGFDGSQGVVGFTGSQGDIGFTGSKGDTGMGFTIAKIYTSVAQLLADTSPTGIVAGQFAIVETGDVEDPDNGRLYLWDGLSYSFVTDLSGVQGLQGPKGDDGFTGSQGITGFDGSQGDIGFTGSQGDIGFTGSQGDIGFTGSQGDIGFTGSQGDIGFTGSQGDIGFTGSQGDIGFTGSQGEDGVGGLNVTNMIGYAVTNTLASGFTAPSTLGLHYLISSIHVTNISANDGWITAEQSLSGGSAIQIANQIPVPAGSSIDLLKRFKVLNPDDILNFQANANSAIHVTISYDISDKNEYFRDGVDLTTANMTDVFISSNTNGSYVESCLVVTDVSLDEKVSVVWTDGSDNILGYFAFDLVIPANGSVELLEKPKFIANGNKIRAQSAFADTIEILVSGKNL
jgi:hypothetical protein